MSSTQIGFKQVAQLVNKFEMVGWDTARISQLGQANVQKFLAIEAVLDGATLDAALGVAASVRDNTSHLRFLQSTTLAPTTGGITLAQASDVYTGYIDPKFKNWGTDVVGEDTSEQMLDILEMKKEGDYRTLFGSLSTDPRSLRSSQGQIVEFCRTHSDLLRQEEYGYGTFFLFEVKDELFVALVRVGSGALRVYVDRFADGDVWHAGNRPRLVVPQQTL